MERSRLSIDNFECFPDSNEESTEPQDGYSQEEGGEGTELEGLCEEVRHQPGTDRQETVVVSGEGEGVGEPVRGEGMSMEVLVNVPRLEGGTEERCGQSTQQSASQQHSEAGPDLI